MNVLITGAWQNGRSCISKFEQSGHRVCFAQQERDPLPCSPDWVEAVIGNGLFLYHDISEFSNLKYIQLTSAGFDRVPMDYVREHGIRICNARGVYSIPMAEFAVFGVLQLYKQGKAFLHAQESHRWEKQRGLLELYGRTVCVAGCGSVGNECARRFRAFGCEVIGVDLFPRTDADYREIYPLTALDTALQQADILVLTLPLTEQTRHLIDERRLRLLKPGAILVNIARGAVVEPEVLLKVLPDLGGAVLDVFEEEPLPADSPLWDQEKVILTPHNSFVGDGNAQRLDHVILNGFNIR